MDEAFIIMQIGNSEMDRVCDDVVVPAIEAAGLVARRVDRDNEGGLLKAEIIDFLERSMIIVADVTNERPNCYLEVGYAFGLGKKRNLILTAREDHYHRSPRYRSDGPRVHFDLEGYDLLFWDPKELDDFRAALEERIRRRVAILEPPAADEPNRYPNQRSPVTDDEWLSVQHEVATAGLSSINLTGCMEADAALLPKGSWRQSTLLAAVEASQIKTFGWPIGIVINRDPLRPHPTSDGVRAEVRIRDDDDRLDRASYDYWYVRQTGDFYLLQSLFEDSRIPDAIFFDTRIVRTTELALFLSRLYARLDVPDSTRVRIELTHSGLRGRTLRAAGNRSMPYERTTQEESVSASVECSVAELQTQLVQVVRALLEPLFMVFDFLELADEIWTQIVNGFVEGRLS
jgi:hypothetical protein